MTQPSPTPPYFTIRQFAAYVGVGSRTVSKWLKSQGLPFIRCGKVIRIPSDQAAEWLRRQVQVHAPR